MVTSLAKKFSRLETGPISPRCSTYLKAVLQSFSVQLIVYVTLLQYKRLVDHSGYACSLQNIAKICTTCESLNSSLLDCCQSAALYKLYTLRCYGSSTAVVSTRQQTQLWVD